MKNTQIQWVESQLEAYGSITRNECLRNYISRLASIIKKLEKKGYEFGTSSEPFVTKWGNCEDYRYTVIKFPDEIVA